MARTNPNNSNRLTAAERGMTPEDRAIFDGMPQQVETAYRFADRDAAKAATKQLREGGIARAVRGVRS